MAPTQVQFKAKATHQAAWPVTQINASALAGIETWQRTMAAAGMGNAMSYTALQRPMATSFAPAAIAVRKRIAPSNSRTAVISMAKKISGPAAKAIAMAMTACSNAIRRPLLAIGSYRDGQMSSRKVCHWFRIAALSSAPRTPTYELGTRAGTRIHAGHALRTSRDISGT